MFELPGVSKDTSAFCESSKSKSKEIKKKFWPQL